MGFQWTMFLLLFTQVCSLSVIISSNQRFLNIPLLPSLAFLRVLSHHHATRQKSAWLGCCDIPSSYTGTGSTVPGSYHTKYNITTAALFSQRNFFRVTIVPHLTPTLKRYIKSLRNNSKAPCTNNKTRYNKISSL